MLISTFEEITLTQSQSKRLYLALVSEANRLGYSIEYYLGVPFVDVLNTRVYLNNKLSEKELVFTLAHELVHVMQLKKSLLCQALGIKSSPIMHLRARLYARKVGRDWGKNPAEWEAIRLMYSPYRVLRLLKTCN